MPYKITKKGDCYQVSSKDKIHAKCTSIENAKKQLRLLNAVDHGWTPKKLKDHIELESIHNFLESVSESHDIRARCYIIKDDKIWIGLGNEGFEIPGGRIRKGENPKDGAIRETLEEIAIRPLDVTLISIKESKTIIEDYDDANYHKSLVYSYKANYGGIDRSKYDEGPEGKLEPHMVKIPNLIKHYKTNPKYKSWDASQLQNTIDILKFLG